MSETAAAVYVAGFLYACGWFSDRRAMKWLYLAGSLASLLAAIAFELRRPIVGAP